MKGFNFKSIRTKLIGVIFITSSSVLVLLCSAYIIFEFYNYKATLKMNVSTLSMVVASNSAGALAFESKNDANEILEALQADDHIKAAALYDNDGKLFAIYPASAPPNSVPPKPAENPGRFENARFSIFTPVIQNGTELGKLYVSADLELLYSQLQRNALLAVLMIFISLALTFLFSSFLQKSITRPILTLKTAAKSISEDHDYSVRAIKVSNDEIGQLTDAFNQMLQQIETQTAALIDAQYENAQYAAMVEFSDDAIIGKTLDGIITTWNAAAQRIFGYKAEEMIGNSVLKLIPPSLRHEEEIIINQLKNGFRIGSMETQRITKDHKIIDVSLTISPVKNQEGMVIGASKIARDISRQKKTERQIFKNEEQLRLAANAAELGTFDIDIPSRALEWDNRCLELFGLLNHRTLNYKQMLEAIHEEDRHRVVALLSNVFKAVAREESYDFDFRTVGVDVKKLRWLRAKGKVYFNDAGEPARIIGALLDVTDKKEEELRKNDFISIVSHELKTPLTSVKAYIQLLIKKASTQDAERFNINVLHRTELQISKMEAMIQDFLSLARLEEGRLQVNKQLFSLKELLEEVKTDITLLSISHTIILDPITPVEVEADREKINQVVTNLLNNAIKYSDSATTIRFGYYPEAGRVRIYVADEGVGISPEDQKKLFDRFYRVKNERSKNVSGFGIGLYIVSEILRYHDSHIEITSEEGKGSVFSFLL